MVTHEVGRPQRDWQSEAVGLLSFNVPDFWFVYLSFLGVPCRWLAGILLLLVGLTAGIVLRLRRVLTRGCHRALPTQGPSHLSRREHYKR